MKLLDPPPPTYDFGYRQLPQSGNEINGLGEAERRRARPVFHDATGCTLAWSKLDNFFGYICRWGIIKYILANVWQLRRRNGPVAPAKVDVEDPQAMASQIKAKAKELGASLVGVTHVVDEALFEGRSLPHKFVISIAMAMDREEMMQVPHERAAVEVMRVYYKVSRIAIRLSEEIRAMGWPAVAYGNPNSTDILHIPHAIAAGIGQLGKHGSIISKEFGSNIRLSAVTTDLPLAVDSPVDVGVDDVCETCTRCVSDCPPDAIHNERQLVRGEKKWYVDFDKCIPYFIKTEGCAICIEVCPWSEPGRGKWLSEKMLARRARQP